MREIVEKIAKWLVAEFFRFPKQLLRRSVKHSESFIESLVRSGKMDEAETVVSFDVSALFPSLPVNRIHDLHALSKLFHHF